MLEKFRTHWERYQNHKKRSKHWDKSYPTVIYDPEKNKIPYGDPNEPTLHIFRRLNTHPARVLDVAGGYGRYALPIAEMGHHVTVLDVDDRHLIQLQENAAELQPVHKDNISILKANALAEFPLTGSFDAVLNAGFAYVLPPDKFATHMSFMADALRPGGSMVLEFATNRVRLGDKGNSLIGENEHNYSYEEGLRTLLDQFVQNNIQIAGLATKTIHLEEPYYLHNNLIIAHGLKQG